jgi:deoxyribodipyrimidine photolyase-related protein
MGFFDDLSARNAPASRTKRWIYAPYDQLTAAVGPLSEQSPADSCVLLIENPAKAGRRNYHKQKLLLVLANQRNFALEQAERGVHVRYVIADDYASAVAETAANYGPLVAMEPAERELHADLAPAVEAGALTYVPHAGFLSHADDLEASAGVYRMDAFYKRIRRRTGVLMEGGKPIGGRFSFDGENRLPWRPEKGDPAAPKPLQFASNSVKEEVVRLIERHFADHVGTLRPELAPTTVAEASAVLDHAIANLANFGPFEDAMSTRSEQLFHSKLSALMNLHRILPQDALARALSAPVPIASKEGFVRQILGWREFVRRVHRATDGFRTVPTTNALSGHEPLPSAYWGTPSGLACLDHCVRQVLGSGYTHHIPRLMVLSNLATLLGISPRELTDWFWVAFEDAFDWVVEPNVLAMGTFAVGDVMTTKPYVSGAAYISKMSDFCGGCAFDPKSTCPITRFYWNFLERNREVLGGNMRMKLPLASAAKRSADDRAEDARFVAIARSKLAAGVPMTPRDFSKTTLF